MAAHGQMQPFLLQPHFQGVFEFGGILRFLARQFLKVSFGLSEGPVIASFVLEHHLLQGGIVCQRLGIECLRQDEVADACRIRELSIKFVMGGAICPIALIAAHLVK